METLFLIIIKRRLSIELRWKYLLHIRSCFDLFVKDIVVQGNSFISANYRVIPVECVIIILQPSYNAKIIND